MINKTKQKKSLHILIKLPVVSSSIVTCLLSMPIARLRHHCSASSWYTNVINLCVVETNKTKCFSVNIVRNHLPAKAILNDIYQVASTSLRVQPAEVNFRRKL